MGEDKKMLPKFKAGQTVVYQSVRDGRPVHAKVKSLRAGKHGWDYVVQWGGKSARVPEALLEATH